MKTIEEETAEKEAEIASNPKKMLKAIIDKKCTPDLIEIV
jgi:hypothetical protein